VPCCKTFECSDDAVSVVIFIFQQCIVRCVGRLMLDRQHYSHKLWVRPMAMSRMPISQYTDVTFGYSQEQEASSIDSLSRIGREAECLEFVCISQKISRYFLTLSFRYLCHRRTSPGPRRRPWSVSMDCSLMWSGMRITTCLALAKTVECWLKVARVPRRGWW
jgi:hypothetical protein